VLLPNTYRAFFGGFTHLHLIQRQAIAPILAGCDLVLQSATGSGKTEAVLAPCMERVIRGKRADAVVYVVPTKALAIDLERRLAPVLSQRLGLRFGIRTGDVKRAGGERPDLMLITPESLDVLLGSANTELKQFIKRVRTVIIDEIHPFLHQYRGRQLSFLLQRLERRTGGPVQKIALSATIADVDAVIESFGFSPHAVRLISAVQRDIVPHLVHLKRGDEELIGLLDDLDRVWGYRKILIFANSRGQCDRLFALASQQGAFRGIAELHYSNLKPRERRGVEDRFRRRDHALCIATSTLELGIDIGDVDGVLLFEPPDSVSAFLQRIGRSNRRQKSTQFWGICRGERAGEQLLRFLGLLRLARQGSVEAPLPNTFPSVLVQQILSCLYEKKGISLPAMKDLFPGHSETLERLFPSMEKQGWLRRDPSLSKSSASLKRMTPSHRSSALFRGGWRYRNALLDRRIWSNFPETEEDYVLEISGEAVADLPRSIVRQLSPGDRVHLAGKRIRILQMIDSGERKRVVAEPTEQLDEKEILWLGGGFQVSFEVAQSMRDILSLPEEAADLPDLGLFARTRELLREQRRKNGRVATLANGIEVLREANGFYRYRTFWGSMANLVLRLTVEKDLGAQDELYVGSDEIGITCSHWIDFRALSLPVDRDGFRSWVAGHLRPLRAFLPLNAFADALPDTLLVEELAGFFNDSRIAGRFLAALSHPSEIVSGDPGALELAPEESKGPARDFLQPSACECLLAREKKRWGIDDNEPAFVIPADTRHIARRLTGTLIGEYLRHRQCERRLSLHFLPPDRQPPKRPETGSQPETIRTERGRLHEKRVLEHLRNTGASLIVVEETDDRGKPRHLEDRFLETLDRLESSISKLHPGESFYLSQSVFRVPSLLAEYFDTEIASAAPQSVKPAGGRDDSTLTRIEGIGIPDLVRVSMSGEGPRLTVGDIKDSLGPYYSQKWQVAFYALLVKACIRAGRLPPNAVVSGKGFLILRPGRDSTEPALHPFDLAPFMSAFPALLQNMGEIIAGSPAHASFRLQAHCTTCPYFETCYRQALQEEDIQFLPQLSEGALLKLRQLGLRSINDAGKFFEAVTHAHMMDPKP
jgi:superfamily II DNA/RNA helicase